MAIYSNPVDKTWVLNNAAGFKKGAFSNTEFENPNYADKVVLACGLGENILQNAQRDWNPSFETPDVPPNNRPLYWRLDFVSGSAGSEYIQDGPNPYDGYDYVRLKNQNLHKGLLGLCPSISPYAVNLVIDQAKFYTIRYHGCFHNPQFETPRPCDGMVTLEDTEVGNPPKQTPYGFAPFAEYDPLPTSWVPSDYRIHPNAPLVERKIQALVLMFGLEGVNYYPGESWDIDMVVVAETFPENASFYALGQYESPVLYTPPTVSRVTWGTFVPVVDIPQDTSIAFFVRGYDTPSRACEGVFGRGWALREGVISEV